MKRIKYLMTTIAFIFSCLFAVTAEESASAGIPKLVDLGATKCIPCKRMAPILEELKINYTGALDVQFIDVWQKENEAQAEKYGIETIPTQIFLSPEGKELFRHVGFFAKEDILAKWKELGFDLKPKEATKQ
jgi:thioredoxin 1